MTCKRIEKCANGEFCNYHVGILVSSCMNFKEKKKQTNEEWFCGLSTEEKAEWLSNRDEFIYDCGQRSLTPKIMDKDEWEEWLKQPHTNEVEK